MDAAQERQPQVTKGACQRFVGFHHEHLDQCVGETGVFALNTLDVSRVIKQQVHIRQIQRNHAVGTAALA